IVLSLYPGRLWPGGPTVEDSVRSWRRDHPGSPRYAGFVRAGTEFVRQHPVRALLSLGWGPLLLGLAIPGGWALRRRPADLGTLAAVPGYGLLVHLPLHAEP